MSQKKLRKLRQVEISNKVQETRALGEVLGIWQIIKENWLFLILLVVGLAILYTNGMNGAFVSDDYASITQNPMVTNLWVSSKGINLVAMANSVVASIFGITSPTPFHVFSLVAYILVCILSFIWLRMWFDKEVTMLTVAIFAVLPIHVENVSWISGRPYIFIAFFSLICFILFSRYVQTGKKKFGYLFLFSLPWPFLVERARGFTMVFVLILFIYYFRKKFQTKINWSKWILIGAGGIVVMAIVLWPMILVRVNNVNSGYNTSESIFYNPFFQYPTSITKYLQLMLFPLDLTLYHTMYILPVWLNWLVFLSFILAVVYYWFKNKEVSFALAFIFISSAPSMAPVKVSWLVAERYVFLGTLGLCLALVLVFLPVLKRLKFVAPMILVVLLAIFGARTFMRNRDWRTNHSLWVNTCQVSPNSHNAWNNIGDDYDKLKDYENAIKGFSQSTVVKPNYADAFHNRANIFFKIGRLDLARDSYETALKFSPGLLQTYLSLTQIDLIEHRGDLAMMHATTATKMAPENPQGWYVLGVVQSQLGQNPLAIESMKKTLQIDPNYKPAYDAMVQLTGGSLAR